MFFRFNILNYVLIRPAIHTHILFRQNFRVNGNFFCKTTWKITGKKLHLFSHLMTSKIKILWHAILYGPKKPQEWIALFFFSQIRLFGRILEARYSQPRCSNFDVFLCKKFYYFQEEQRVLHFCLYFKVFMSWSATYVVLGMLVQPCRNGKLRGMVQ